MALGSTGHKITVTRDGLECADEYAVSCKNITSRNSIKSGINDANASPDLNSHSSVEINSPTFDVVILDYKMPVKDALYAAKVILGLRPAQRIIFASAFVRQTVMDSVKQMKMVLEILEKPFTLDV